MIIEARHYEAQDRVITARYVARDDPLIEKFGFSPIVVVDGLWSGDGQSLCMGSKAYAFVRFAF